MVAIPRAQYEALMAAAKALKPLADHVGIFELGFSVEEIAAIDKEHHLIAHGITLADAYRARACLAALRAAGRATLEAALSEKEDK